MMEIELKFQLPQAQQHAVLTALQNMTAPNDIHPVQNIHLRALYFDTAQRHLSQNAMAIRLRQENDTWVQTFKAKGKNSFERIEHDYTIQSINLSAPAEMLNLDIYQSQPVIHALLQQALSDQDVQALQLQFETDVKRQLKLFTYEDAIIELSVDIGEIKTSTTSQVISEIEFELKQGNTSQLLAFAAQWVEQYQLWLDVRSKAERGNLLSMSRAASGITLPKAAPLHSNMPLQTALQHMVSAQIEHLLPNMAVVVDAINSVAHRKQTRLALQQLHSSMKSYAQHSPLMNKHWSTQLKYLLKELDDACLSDVFEQDIVLQLHCVVPNLNRTSSNNLVTTDYLTLLAQKLSAPETQQLLLQLLGFAYRNSSDLTAQSNDTGKKLLAPMRKLYARIDKQAKHFATLPAHEQQRLFKRMKRLRDGIHAIIALLEHNQWRDFMQQLDQTLQHFYHYHDIIDALQKVQTLTPQSAREQAIDYLQSQQLDAHKRLSKALKQLRKTEQPF